MTPLEGSKNKTRQFNKKTRAASIFPIAVPDVPCCSCLEQKKQMSSALTLKVPPLPYLALTKTQTDLQQQWPDVKTHNPPPKTKQNKTKNNLTYSHRESKTNKLHKQLNCLGAAENPKRGPSPPPCPLPPRPPLAPERPISTGTGKRAQKEAGRKQERGRRRCARLLPKETSGTAWYA